MTKQLEWAEDYIKRYDQNYSLEVDKPTPIELYYLYTLAQAIVEDSKRTNQVISPKAYDW